MALVAVPDSAANMLSVSPLTSECLHSDGVIYFDITVPLPPDFFRSRFSGFNVQNNVWYMGVDFSQCLGSFLWSFLHKNTQR